VPIPEASDLAGLNTLLLARCIESQQHVISGRNMTIAAGMAAEKPYLLPLAEEGFELEETLFPLVDGKGCVRVKTNWYSTPLQPGQRAMVKVWPTEVVILHDLERVAGHPRCYGRGHQILNLEHYNQYLNKSFSQMFPEHTCTGRCGPAQECRERAR